MSRMRRRHCPSPDGYRKSTKSAPGTHQHLTFHTTYDISSYLLRVIHRCLGPNSFPCAAAFTSLRGRADLILLLLPS